MTSVLDTTTTLPSGTWNVDATHSQVGFAVEYMVGTFRGTFSPFEATLTNGVLEGAAPVSGVHVQDENLTAHLQSPDFFDAELAPTIRFHSTAIERTGDEITIAGDLTMRGVTRRVELTGTVGEPAEDPFGGTRFSLRLEGTINRTLFGIDWNNPLPNGQPALAADVTLTAELYLVKA